MLLDEGPGHQEMAAVTRYRGRARRRPAVIALPDGLRGNAP
jgi:hypothetical protein